MRHWSNSKTTDGERCTFDYREDSQTRDRQDIINITVYDSSSKIIARGRTEDEAYNDAREELRERFIASCI